MLKPRKRISRMILCSWQNLHQLSIISMAQSEWICVFASGQQVVLLLVQAACAGKDADAAGKAVAGGNDSVMSAASHVLAILQLEHGHLISVQSKTQMSIGRQRLMGRYLLLIFSVVPAASLMSCGATA